MFNEIYLNSKGEYKYDWIAGKQSHHISYIDLLEGKVDPNKITGKYVVLGYNSEKIHQVATPEGLMNAHITFYEYLLSVIASIELMFCVSDIFARYVVDKNVFR